MPSPNARRTFIKRALAAGAALVVPTGAAANLRDAPRQVTGVGQLDHVAVPMRNVEAMIAFYRTLGFVVREGASIVSVHFADQKINFHRPALWQRETFTLRAAAAEPPCGDFCWVWNGTEAELRAAIERTGSPIETEGRRDGGRDGGDAVGESIYLRDPDANLLEFIRYA
jgi:catechol 2,3-dioxygenase-like lactoylglutathione lyase family enzyme